MPAAPALDLRSLPRHALAVAAFCALIATVLTLAGRSQWDMNLVCSLSIGVTSWLVIDLGRLLLTRGHPIPWPRGWRGIALVAAGITAGLLVGDAASRLYADHPLLGGEALVSSLAITVAASGGASLLFYLGGKARMLETQIAAVQRDAAEARLKLLETQLEPHMLFNTLANLRVLIAADPARAQAMLDHLIAYLRATLSASRSPWHPLAEEFARLQDYLALMAVRMGPRLAYTLELPPALAQVAVPPLLLQPLVENAIRHGLEPQPGPGRILVRAERQGTGEQARLVLQVLDNGAGLAPEPLLPHAAPVPGRHFGLAQVRERLATLYGPAGTLELRAGSAGGTLACVTFPLKTP